MGTYWTIQSFEKWLEIQEKGYLIGNPDFVDPDFVDAYNWLIKKMNEKNIVNNQGECPIWLWTERPDLRKKGYLPSKKQGVLLKINIEDSRVLLSDYEAWHFVLNNWYFNIDMEEDEIDEMYEKGISRSELEESWELIFDLDYLNNHPDWGPRLIQGITNKISLSEITLVKTFIGR